MHGYHDSIRTIRSASAAVCLAVLLASCATQPIRDNLEPEAPRGWVAFVSEQDLFIQIVQIENGLESEPFNNTDFWMSPVAIARAPGRGDFIVQHKDSRGRLLEERLVVPVTEKAITYVGIRKQVESIVRGSETTITYYVRSSVGAHPLPYGGESTDPGLFLDALDDPDWGTRSQALAALERMRQDLDDAAIYRLTAIAREDPSYPVRNAANGLLKALRKPMPARALAMVSFQWSADDWQIGTSSGSVTTLVPDGYLLEGKDTESATWRMPYQQGTINLRALANREDLDFILECSWMSGKQANAFGLALGSDAETFHAFCVSRNNGMIIARFADNLYASAPMPWKTDRAAAVDRAPFTRIVVSKRGDRYEMSVNGTPVGGFTDETSLAVTRFGVFVDDVQSVVFRKIVALAP
jgi:hypothetical protein